LIDGERKMLLIQLLAKAPICWARKCPAMGGIKCRNSDMRGFSTRDEDLAAQDAELMAAGCAKVFNEKVSGAKTDRPELAKVIGA